MPPPSGNLLARLDERLKALQDDVKEIKENHEAYVTREEFMPIKKAIYGAIGVLLTGAFYGIAHVVWHFVEMMK